MCGWCFVCPALWGRGRIGDACRVVAMVGYGSEHDVGESMEGCVEVRLWRRGGRRVGMGLSARVWQVCRAIFAPLLRCAFYLACPLPHSHRTPSSLVRASLAPPGSIVIRLSLHPTHAHERQRTPRLSPTSCSTHPPTRTHPHNTTQQKTRGAIQQGTCEHCALYRTLLERIASHNHATPRHAPQAQRQPNTPHILYSRGDRVHARTRLP